MTDLTIKQNLKTTRRKFIGGVGATAGATTLSVLPELGLAKVETAASGPAVKAKPVCSVFMDMAIIDMTGTMEPYIPPASYHSDSPQIMDEDYYLHFM